MNNILYQKYAPHLLRLGLVFVLAWFGSSQLFDPAPWTGLIPLWITNMGISATAFVYLNGSVEIVLAILLVFNIATRLVSLLVALHLLTIVFDVGLTGVGVRDIGLMVMALASAALGSGKEEVSTI